MAGKTKTCIRCGETKPVSEYLRHYRTADGLKNTCTECHKQRLRAAKLPKSESTFKECPKCQQTKPIEQFFNIRSPEQETTHCDDCRARHRAWSRASVRRRYQDQGGVLARTASSPTNGTSIIIDDTQADAREIQEAVRALATLGVEQVQIDIRSGEYVYKVIRRAAFQWSESDNQ